MSELPTHLLTLSDTQFAAWMKSSNTPLDRALVDACKSHAQQLAERDELAAALRLLDCAMQIADVLDDPLAYALVWRGRANVLQHHERFTDSLDATQNAVKLYRQHGSDFDVAVARTVEVAVLGALERYEEAIALALWIRPHFVEADFVFGQARLAHALAYVYTLAWRLEEALAEYQSAQELFVRLELPLDSAWVLLNMGILANQMDRLELAHDYYLRAYPVFVEHGDTLMVVKTLFNLAQSCVRRAQYDEALNYLAQARTHLIHLPDSADAGYVDLHEAQTRIHLNELEEAERLLRRSLASFTAQGRQIESVETLIELGLLLGGYALPEKVAEGLACLQQAQRYLHEHNIDLFSAWVQLEQAELLLKLNRRDESFRLAGEAARRFTESGLALRQAHAEVVQADCSWATQPAQARRWYEAAMQSVGDGPSLLAARCWQGLGVLAMQQADPVAAEGAFAQALAMLDSLRHLLRRHNHQAGFLAGKQELADLLLAAVYAQPASAAKLFVWLERLKARALAELLADQPPDYGIDDQLAALWAERESVTEQIDRHTLAFSSAQTLSLQANLQPNRALLAHDRYQTQELAELRRHLHSLDEQLARQLSPPNRWRTGATFDAGQVHALLDDDTLLLSYFAIHGKLYVLSATNALSELQIFPLPATLSDIEQQWQQLRRLLVRPGPPNRALLQRLSQLHRQLIAPVSHLLAHKSRLLILPYQSMVNIPFAALYDEERQSYLVQQHTLHTAPSATVYTWRRQQEAPLRSPLLVAFPGEPDSPHYLPHVHAEVMSLAALLPDHQLLIDADATVEALLTAMPARRLVHFAGHALFDPQDPLASGMPLHGGRWLRASDLYLRCGQLAGATVVLSACDSGRVAVAGNDPLGLVSAFLYAGASAVVAGLWRVDDAATALLMQHFYSHLSQSADIATALRHAQLALLAHPLYAAPYFWSPFTLIGANPTLFAPHEETSS